MKLVVFESEDWEKPFFEALNKDHELVFEQEPLDVDTIGKYSDAEIISPFVFSDLSCEILSQMPNLKFIATRSTGFDHIDIEYCKEYDIKVSNVPNYGENTVAEHVFALLLSLSHKIPEAINRTRQGDFSQKGLQGFDLRGRTMGIIGTGSIGLKTIRIANGFDMNVVAYDVKPDTALQKENSFLYVSLPELLERSDVISVHVPENNKTRNFLSYEQFDAMKDGVVLINTARGNVVDVKALLHALSEGKVAAAGLDVLPEEPTIREEAELLRSFFTRKHELETLLADHILLHMKNVIITPHSAFNTKEAVQRILNTTLQNLEGFLDNSIKNSVL
jgi:D-lactate dehydrogenase